MPNLPINPDSESIQHLLTGGAPVEYATLASVKVVVDEIYDAENFEINTAAPLGFPIAAVDQTDIMLTTAPHITNDGTNYYMQFAATLAIMVESTTAYQLLQQVLTFDANLGPMCSVTPPDALSLPLITINAVNHGFTANSVTSTVSIAAFNIPVGQLKSVRVVLNASDPIGQPIFCDSEA